jgi:hypothetical protein
MGIFKSFINKILDAEVPPTVEKFVKKELAKKGSTEENLPASALFSMKIEDVFSIPGRGTVVTGKIDAGSVKLNDEITIVSESQKKITKVVSIEKANKLIGEAKIGDEVGLLLDKIKQNEVKKGYIVTKDEGTNFVNIKHQIGPVIYSEDEVIPVEKYIKNAIISSNGLYPHEILVLNYASKYYTTNNDYQGFWWYRYGVKDIDAILSSLRKRNFLEIGDIKSTLEHKTVENLKNILKKHNLKISGKKVDLIQRLLDKIPSNTLDIECPQRIYQLTDLGKEEINKEDYVLYVHNHPREGLDIWSLNKLVYTEPRRPYRDKIWTHLNQCGDEYFSNGNFGLYRNCRYSMFQFLIEEDRIKEAVEMLAEVVFYDLCGAVNNYSPDTFDIVIEGFFPYEDSTATIAPGIIQDIIECKENLEYSDDELKKIMLERINKLSTPIKLFTPDECVDIVIMEINKDIESLKKIYLMAEHRLKRSHL